MKKTQFNKRVRSLSWHNLVLNLRSILLDFIDNFSDFSVDVFKSKNNEEFINKIGASTKEHVHDLVTYEDNGFMGKNHLIMLTNKADRLEMYTAIAEAQLNGEVNLAYYETVENSNNKLALKADKTDIPNIQGLASERFVLDSIQAIPLHTKVDFQPNKQLSTEDYTTSEKIKLQNIDNTIESVVNNKINTIVGNAPQMFDTLGEIASWIESSEDSTYDILNTLSFKANLSDLNKFYKTQEVDSLLNLKANKSDLLELSNKVEYLENNVVFSHRVSLLEDILSSKVNTSDFNLLTQVVGLKLDKLEAEDTYLRKNNNMLLDGLKIITKDVVATDGFWTVDYSTSNFIEPPKIFPVAYTINEGSNAGDGRYATVIKESITNTSARGKLNSASSAGLLAAMVNVHASGQITLLIIGK